MLSSTDALHHGSVLPVATPGPQDSCLMGFLSLVHALQLYFPELIALHAILPVMLLAFQQMVPWVAIVGH